MEELKPLQPRVEDESEVQVVLERAGGDMDGSTAVTEGPNTPSVLAVPVASHLAPTNGGSPSTTTSLPPTQPSLFPQQLFDSHPIQQPLLTSRDDIASLTHLAPPPNHSPDALRQVSQPVQPTPDAMADKQVKVGDEVSWNWGGNAPSGTVAEVKTSGEASITTKNDNVVKKNAEPDNPAVVLERSGNDVVKKASELNIEQSGSKEKESAADSDKKENGDSEKKENGDAETGDKRKAEETSEEKKDEEGAGAKKQKKDNKPKENGAEAPKKKGRPAKKDANGETKPKKEPAKKKAPKRAATESGEPRRSGRNASK